MDSGTNNYPLERPTKKGGEPNFGTYHHTTASASYRIRTVVKDLFIDAFRSLPFEKNDDLMILDVGCGLGFLSCVSGEFYRNARVIGIDTFRDASLKRSSLQKAKENAKVLGLADRIEFRKCNLLEFTPRERFDLFVSNLVYHNLGKRKFVAYSRLSSWTDSNSFVVLGDIFFSPKKDTTQLSKDFRILRKIEPKIGSNGYSLLVMSKS